MLEHPKVEPKVYFKNVQTQKKSKMRTARLQFHSQTSCKANISTLCLSCLYSNIAGIFTFSDIMERNGFKTFLQQLLHIMRLWAKSRHTCRIIVMVLGLIIINIVQYCGTLLSVFIYFLFYFDSPASCVTVFCFDREELSHVGDQLYSLLFLISLLPSCVFSPLSSSFCCWFICVSSLVFPIFRFLVSYNI